MCRASGQARRPPGAPRRAATPSARCRLTARSPPLHNRALAVPTPPCPLQEPLGSRAAWSPSTWPVTTRAACAGRWRGAARCGSRLPRAGAYRRPAPAAAAARPSRAQPVPRSCCIDAPERRTPPPSPPAPSTAAAAAGAAGEAAPGAERAVRGRPQGRAHPHRQPAGPCERARGWRGGGGGGGGGGGRGGGGLARCVLLCGPPLAWRPPAPPPAQRPPCILQASLDSKPPSRLSRPALLLWPPSPHAAQASLDSITSQTRVVISTAGPFALIGTPVVEAAVRGGAHYVDITGGWPGAGCSGWLAGWRDNAAVEKTAAGCTAGAGSGVADVPRAWPLPARSPYPPLPAPHPAGRRRDPLGQGDDRRPPRGRGRQGPAHRALLRLRLDPLRPGGPAGGWVGGGQRPAGGWRLPPLLRWQPGTGGLLSSAQPGHEAGRPAAPRRRVLSPPAALACALHAPGGALPLAPPALTHPRTHPHPSHACTHTHTHPTPSPHRSWTTCGCGTASAPPRCSTR